MSVRAGWSKDKEDWKRLSKCVKNNNIKWRKEKYFKGSFIRIPDKAGIYMLCSSPPKQTLDWKKLFTPLYIGRSKHLRTRLNEHISKPQASILDVYDITTTLEVLYTTCNENNLAEVEDCLIRAFGPITNVINAKNQVEILEPIQANLGKMEKIKILGD